MSQWKLRKANSEDLSFLFSSWLKSYRNNSTVAGIPNTTYYDNFHRLLSNLLSTPSIITIIACDPDDEKIIFGYVVAEVDQAVVSLHWVYVKHALRNFGMATALVDEIKTIPHDTLKYSTRSRNATEDMVYDPFTLWKFCK